MRIAALYDIHGNLPALEAVLAEVRAAAVDEIVVGGDVVPGPMPRECLALILNNTIPTRFISGNCEREMLGLMRDEGSRTLPDPVRTSLRWSAEQLDEPMIRAIAGWPATLRSTHASSGEILFCHASPRNDIDIFTRRTAEERLRPLFASAEAAIVLCGHTHMQFDRMIGDTRVVNAGSVGMSFQGRGAYWALIGDTTELRRTEYDLPRAAERIRATAYPQAADFAERYVLHPPSEDETLELYTSYELKPA